MRDVSEVLARTNAWLNIPFSPMSSYLLLWIVTPEACLAIQGLSDEALIDSLVRRQPQRSKAPRTLLWQPRYPPLVICQA